MEIKKSETGKLGEEIAANYLIQKGYEIIKQNYRYGHGEIDLVVKSPDSNQLIFIEVKTRNNLELGDPAYAINKKKISQIKKVAELYLYDNGIKETECRFDVITVSLINPKNPVIEHYENAFF